MCFSSEQSILFSGGQPFLAGVDFFFFALQHQTRAPYLKILCYTYDYNCNFYQWSVRKADMWYVIGLLMYIIYLRLSVF